MCNLTVHWGQWGKTICVACETVSHSTLPPISSQLSFSLVPRLFFVHGGEKFLFQASHSWHSNQIASCEWCHALQWMVIKAVEALCRRLSLVEPENDRRRNPRTSVNGRCVFLSLKFLRLSNVDKIVSGLSEVDRSFMFCESSFLGVWKLREGWSLQQAVSLELFRSFKLCVTSHITFLTTLRHQFLNRTEQKLNRQLTRLFFPSAYEK